MHFNKYTMAQSIIFWYQVLSCVICWVFSFVKCCSKQQYPTTTKIKQPPKSVDYLSKKDLLQPTVFFGIHFLYFLYQNYFEVHKMSITNVLRLGGVFSMFPIWYLPLKKWKKNYSQWKIFVKGLTKQRFLGKHGWYEVPENQHSPLKQSEWKTISHERGTLTWRTWFSPSIGLFLQQE